MRPDDKAAAPEWRPVPVPRQRFAKMVAAIGGRDGVGEQGSPPDTVRDITVREALTQSKGNIAQAAVTLGITRQAVLQIIRRLKLLEWVSSVREGRGPADDDKAGEPRARA